MRSTSYTATSITEVPIYLYPQESNSELSNGKYGDDSEITALNSGDSYAWFSTRLKNSANHELKSPME